MQNHSACKVHTRPRAARGMLRKSDHRRRVDHVDRTVNAPAARSCLFSLISLFGSFGIIGVRGRAAARVKAQEAEPRSYSKYADRIRIS